MTEHRRVTIEFAKDYLHLPWWNSSLEFSSFYDHATRTVPEWLITGKGGDTRLITGNTPAHTRENPVS